MDWGSAVQHALEVAGSGGSAFVGALFQFKKRLKACEDALVASRATVTALQTKVNQLQEQLEDFKQDFEREQKHQRELNDVRAMERASRPDPLEELRQDLAQLRQDIERIKERGSRYVRSDVFATFTKAQEDQWKEMQRTLGRLEGVVKGL